MDDRIYVGTVVRRREYASSCTAVESPPLHLDTTPVTDHFVAALAEMQCLRDNFLTGSLLLLELVHPVTQDGSDRRASHGDPLCQLVLMARRPILFLFGSTRARLWPTTQKQILFLIF